MGLLLCYLVGGGSVYVAVGRLVVEPPAPSHRPRILDLISLSRTAVRERPGAHTRIGELSFASELDALPKGKSITAQFSYGAGVDEQRGVVTRLVAKPWAYILAVPITTYTKAADDATFNALSVVVIGLLLSFVIGVLLTRSLVGPLRRLVGDATAVSTGDVDLRVAAFDTRTGDDITREVASAFDRMLNALRFYALSDEPAGGDD